MTEEEKTMEEFASEEAEKVVDIAMEEAAKILSDMTEEEKNKVSVTDLVREISDVIAGSYKKQLHELVDERLQEDKEQIREFLDTPERIKYGNTKIENELKRPTRNLLETIRSKDKGFDVEIASKKDKASGDSYIVPLTLIVDENVTFPNNFDYTLTNKLIVDTVGNLYDQSQINWKNEGIPEVRADHLINYMDRKPLTTRVRPERVEEIVEIIHHLRNVDVEIDTEKHALYNDRNKRKVQVKSEIIRDSLLPVGVRIKDSNSKDKQTYLKLRGRPPLYDYAIKTGQLISIDYDTLDLTAEYLPDGTTEPTPVKRMTQQVRSIGNFLIQEIYGRGRLFPDYVDITYNRIYEYIENDLGKMPKEQNLNINIERVVDTLIQKKVIKKKSILSKGRVKLAKIRLYKI